MSHQQPVKTIGFLTPYVGSVYFGEVLAGASQAAARHGLRLIVIRETPQEVYRSRLTWDMIDGWIALFDVEGIEQFAQSGMPVVTISGQVGDVPAVLPDNHGGSYASVCHLIEHGHEHIAFVGRMANADIRQRFEGYKAALAEWNIPLDERLVIDVETEMEQEGRNAARRLIELGMPCTAIVTATDQNAFGVIARLQSAGYRIPQDIAVVSFDDEPQAQTSDPPLTSVRVRCEDLGSAAVDLLLAQMSGGEKATGVSYIATTLIMRRSCGCNSAGTLPADMIADVAAAGDWRQAVARKLIQVLLYPVRPDPRTAPALIWPEITTLIGAVEAGLQGRDPPSAAAIEAAWRGAVALTADLEALNRAFDLLEQAGILQLSAESHDRAAYLRLTEAFQVIRRELMRVRVGHETMQVKYLDSVLSAHTIISNAMLGDVVTRAPSLRWLEVTPATWGCLALWEDDRATLTITSTYLRDDHSLSLNGGQYAAAAFPPAEFMSLPMSHGMDMPVLLSLGTAKRAWGVLALGGAIEIELIGNDPFTAWAGMLGAMFDRMALLAELKEQQQQLSQQQAILQAAYDRERALSSTVREIGCPIIPLMSGVLLVPLIGAIDSDRARQITKTVLDAVSAERATDVLIDVTGVPIIDTQVASVLIQMASMIGLLGGRTVLVGVRPEIAQSIVGLGIDLSQIGTCPTLEVALRLLRQSRDMSPARNGRR